MSCDRGVTVDGVASEPSHVKDDLDIYHLDTAWGQKHDRSLRSAFKEGF